MVDTNINHHPIRLRTDDHEPIQWFCRRQRLIQCLCMTLAQTCQVRLSEDDLVDHSLVINIFALPPQVWNYSFLPSVSCCCRIPQLILITYPYHLYSYPCLFLPLAYPYPSPILTIPILIPLLSPPLLSLPSHLFLLKRSSLACCLALHSHQLHKRYFLNTLVASGFPSRVDRANFFHHCSLPSAKLWRRDFLAWL